VKDPLYKGIQNNWAKKFYEKQTVFEVCRAKLADTVPQTLEVIP